MYLSNFLSKRAQQLDLSAAKISLKCGISRQTWYRLIKADFKHIRLETLASIADVLKVSLVELSFLYLKEQQFKETPFMQAIEITDTSPFILDNCSQKEWIVSKEESFEHTWRFLNSSQSTWKKCQLICVDKQLSTHPLIDQSESIQHSVNCPVPQEYALDIPDTEPGESVVVSTRFTAPHKLGASISFWKMVDTKGINCLPENIVFSCQIRVINPFVQLVEA